MRKQHDPARLPTSRRPVAKALIACLLSATVTAHTPISLANTAPADAEAELGAAVDAREELIELKNAVLEAPENPRLRYRLGTAYLQAGDGAAAEKELQRAIDLGLDDFPVRVKLAEAWIAQGRSQDVLLDQDLKEALDTPNQAAVLTLYGKAELGRERLAAARERFEEALTLTSDYAPAQLALARLELTEDNLGAAELLLARLEQGEAPDLAAINEVRGDLEMARGDFDGAEQAYRTALEAAPGRADLMRDAAYAVMSRGEFEAAEAELETVLRRAPNDGNAQMMLAMAAFEQNDYDRAAEIAASFTGPSQSAPLPLYIAGAASYFLGNHEQAQEYLSRYVARVPEDAAGRRVYAATLLELNAGREAYEQLAPLADSAEGDAGLLALLGRAAVMSGRAEEGVTYLERAVALDPDNKAYQVQLTKARLRTSHREQGLAELEAFANDPDIVGARGMLLQERFRAGELQQALTTLDDVQRKGTAGINARILRAKALLGVGQNDDAQALLRRILDEESDNISAVALLAEALLKEGKTQQAVAAAQRLATANPDAVAPQVLLSRIELRANREVAAIARLEELVRTHPTAVDARLSLTDAYAAQQRWDEAERLLENAQHPDAFKVLLARGQLEIAAERPNAAIRSLQQALQQKPDSIEARIKLARAARLNGDLNAAQEAVEVASQLAPENPLVLFERARLALTDLASTQSRLRQAAQDVEALRKRESTSSDVAFLEGQLALRQGDNERGLALLRRAYEITRSSQALLGYTDALWAVGRRELAMDELQQWLEAHPDDVSALLTRASYWLMASDYSAASDDLARARSAGADHAWLDATLSYALARSGDIPAADRYARAALDAAGNDVLALNAMGLVSLARDHARSAVDFLEQAITASGQRAPLSLQLDYAEALQAAGNVNEARTLAQEILARLTPDSPLRARAKALSGR
ncbi:hypothetical protein CKO31_22235 [Thiohalocapsa halophila]|uniref:PEP-CTERM system TPR-repeat protein PrsT n=1 Tax=Thiohalocapsa halophila TaxID=69359 RepID=A0ABS1CPY5_9GAMM|nr:XrtA/PEP-CTERM system TPR-repeat protein PrsT [Thiohalocapsa halophila]MBK1633416.1 hypothetical protein [Thiohalocapsa halophila]